MKKSRRRRMPRYTGNETRGRLRWTGIVTATEPDAVDVICEQVGGTERYCLKLLRANVPAMIKKLGEAMPQPPATPAPPPRPLTPEEAMLAALKRQAELYDERFTALAADLRRAIEQNSSAATVTGLNNEVRHLTDALGHERTAHAATRERLRATLGV